MSGYPPQGYQQGYQQPGYQQGYNPGYQQPPYNPSFAPPPPPAPYYHHPPPAAAPVAVNIVNSQTQGGPAPRINAGINMNTGGGYQQQQQAPQRAQTSMPPASVIGIKAAGGDANPVSIVNAMGETARQATSRLNAGNVTASELTVIMSDILASVESLTIKLSVSHKQLVADATFRGAFMTSVRSVQRLIETARAIKWCCFSNYMGDKKLARVCEQVYQQLSTFSFDNFKLDLSTSGHVGMTGQSGVDYKHSMQSVREHDTVQTVVPAPLVETTATAYVPDERAPLVPPPYGARPY